MMRRGFNSGFRGHTGQFRGFRGRGRGFRNRGTGVGSHVHISDATNSEVALKIAERHQCNNLSFDTKDPQTADRRIYVGNLRRDKVNRNDVYCIYSKYGTITAISNLSWRAPTDYCAFAFVQFTTKEAAQKAAASENGRCYYGYNLDVKVADSPKYMDAQNKAGSSQTARVSSTSESGPLFTKRSLSNRQHGSAPAAKRSKMEEGGPPDILVCGSCHMVFDGLEAMIDHKREPCKSVKKCRCDEENIPDVIACAICHKKLASPWQLILHTSKLHQLEICKNLIVEEEGEAERSQAEPTDEIGEEEFAGDETEEFDVDNDLMEEDLSEQLV